MNNIIERVAELHGVSPEEIRAEMQSAINAAWNDPSELEAQMLLFPEGEPSPTLFIKRAAELIRLHMQTA